MTTIAYANGVMAADTLVVENRVKRLQPTQKIHLSGIDDNWRVFGKKVLGFGFAGTLASIPAFKKYLEMDMKPTVGGIFTTDNDFAVLIVDENLDLYKFNHKQSRDPEECYSFIIKETDDQTRDCVKLAIGSGQDFALAGLSLGKSPLDSVLLASTLDNYTSDHVTIVDFKELV